MVPTQVSVSCGFPIKNVFRGDSFENSYQGYQKLYFSRSLCSPDFLVRIIEQ